MPFIAAGLVFGSAGVPPVGSRGMKVHKITGETPALPKPLPKSSFNRVASAKQKAAEKCKLTTPVVALQAHLRKLTIESCADMSRVNRLK